MEKKEFLGNLESRGFSHAGLGVELADGGCWRCAYHNHSSGLYLFRFYYLY
jgi:hypothetical protein